jgi:hypothetical protein
MSSNDAAPESDQVGALRILSRVRGAVEQELWERGTRPTPEEVDRLLAVVVDAASKTGRVRESREMSGQDIDDRAVMYGRLVTAPLDPNRIDACITVFREQNVPRLAAQPGFRQVFYLMSRRSGKVTTLTLWSSAAAEKASRSGVSRLNENLGDLMIEDEVHLETLEVVYQYPEPVGSHDGTSEG